MARHPKRPRDANQLAKMIVDLATGAVSEGALAPLTPAQESGRKGGLKRAAKLTEIERKASGQRAATARWKKTKSPINQ
jgi:hypothetical protein